MMKRREEGLCLGHLSKPHNNTNISPFSVRDESELLYGRWINDDLHVNKTGTNWHRQQRDAMTAGSRGERSGWGSGSQLHPVGKK